MVGVYPKAIENKRLETGADNFQGFYIRKLFVLKEKPWALRLFTETWGTSVLRRINSHLHKPSQPQSAMTLMR
jgi:hypothetical protein